MRVGLTGGIGSGKSTVAAMFARKGAVVVDADEIARRIVEPGSPVLARLAEEFGADIVQADGCLNRGLLAERAFVNERNTRHLNEITHPAIRELAESELADGERTGAVVIYEMPLLVETGQVSLVDQVVVVDVAEATQIERAVARGLTDDDVRARMARQASRAERLAAADHVITNDEPLDRTQSQVDVLWAEWMRS
ncbi:MAG: dephospho-CoA kinase [Actinomycetota bacterium]|nr:dephospho-CoA kinase [Actinomycetota bacterium]